MLLFLFLSGYRDREILSYGDRRTEAVPPESERPKRSHHRSNHRQTCASKELYGERRNLH